MLRFSTVGPGRMLISANAVWGQREAKLYGLAMPACARRDNPTASIAVYSSTRKARYDFARDRAERDRKP